MKHRLHILGSVVVQGAALFGFLHGPSARELDMKPFWDAARPLGNPHKGWYHHYPDNHIEKYRIERDADLLDFPGMDHVYLRLAWAYLEPEEGRYRWEVIDEIINKWTAHGLGIAFRISCRETGTDRPEQQFATPRWVIDAGARGGFYLRGRPTGPEGPWEPDFGDPVFLEKLEQFLKAFAARYDGRPWLRYVDVGSIGDWGEGHTHSGSRKEYGYDLRKIHVDLHLKHFKKAQLVVSDDFVHALGDPEERRRLHRYVLDHGISYRDDSILVNGYLPGTSDRFTVRSPEFFADAHRKTPTVLELEHYGSIKRLGNWDARPGSWAAQHGKGKSGPDYFRGALELLHATYIGYHGYASEWLEDNPELTVELLNRCGYWYFLHRVEIPEFLRGGRPAPLHMTWENRGVAPAYHDFQLRLRLEGPRSIELDQPAQNHQWRPRAGDNLQATEYLLQLPGRVIPGDYVVKFKLYSPAAERDVQVALSGELMDSRGYYRLGEVAIGD